LPPKRRLSDKCRFHAIVNLGSRHARLVRFRASLLCVVTTSALAAPAKLTTLYQFQGYPDGESPLGPIATDDAGDIFGATEAGGTNNSGTVFALSPPTPGQTTWTETILWGFPTQAHGYFPHGGGCQDSAQAGAPGASHSNIALDAIGSVLT
jgi:hypothetical protein